MKPKSAKAKGQRLQKWVCQKISELTGYEYGPDEMIAPRESGQKGVDVRLIKDALDAFPYSVECKNQEKWHLLKWIEQAKKNRKPKTDWLLVCSRNRNKPVVIMDGEAFFEVLSLISRHRKGR